MIKKIILLTLFIISLLNAKSITGMDGARVTVPNNPKRVVSLSDWKITAVLVELGVNVVGSAGHINKVTGKPFIRAASSMFGHRFF